MATRPKRSRVPREKTSVLSKAYWAAWWSEVANVLSKPLVAISLFLIGVVFVIVASKQLKLVLDYLERQGMEVRESQPFSSLLGVVVFLFIWFDIVVLRRFTTCLNKVIEVVHDRYVLLAEVLHEMALKEKRRVQRVHLRRR